MIAKLRILAFGLALTGCGGGNWSNKDLEFLNALPAKEDLMAKLPSDSLQSGLSASGSGLGTRRDGLAGERSRLYEDSRRASNTFNQALDGLLAIIEAVRRLPPSLREGDSLRLWGPFPSRENPGFQARLVMVREDERAFGYRIEFQRQGSGEWFGLIAGGFLSSGGVRKGVGWLRLSGAEARLHELPDPGLREMDFFDASYSTESWPLYVRLSARSVAGESVEYEYRENEDQSGRMGFRLTKDVTGSPLTLEKLLARSAWRPGGEGRGELLIQAGDLAGAYYRECWDERFLTTWSHDFLGNLSGTESESCRALGALLQR